MVKSIFYMVKRMLTDYFCMPYREHFSHVNDGKKNDSRIKKIITDSKL